MNSVERTGEIHEEDPCIRPRFVQVLVEVVEQSENGILRASVLGVGELKGVLVGCSLESQFPQNDPLRTLKGYRR